MYIPPAFTVDDRRWAVALMERYPFGLLVTCEGAYPATTHLPMYPFERDGELYVAGHVAAANPHAKAIEKGAAATTVFTGAHAFVSASWYREPYQTVPTWNYSAVHASGRLQLVPGREVVRVLSERFEGGAAGGWRIDGLTPEYLEKQLRGIVAFEMRVEMLDAKAKLSQNRSPEDRARVQHALANSDDPMDRACAAAMREVEGTC
jgi:transcriptional regulator